jgi:hypothetical protein
MPKRRYALASGEPKRLELSWKFNWRELVVKLDERQIGGPFFKEDLQRQVFVTMTDGAPLGIMLDTSSRAAELHVTLSGQPLPGSASHPETQVDAAAGAIFVIAALNIILGIGAIVSGWKPLTDIPGAGAGTVAAGAIFLFLGLLVRWQHSKIALGRARFHIIADSVLSILQQAQTMEGNPFRGIVLRIFVIIMMVRGFAAMRKMDQPI